MATRFNSKDKGENDLIGNILSDDATQDFFSIRLSMGRATSAPPPGLIESLTSSTPEVPQNDQNDPTSTKEYYYYYYSLKPHDPRLPKPKWKPAFYDHELIANAPNVILEGNSESGGTNPDDMGADDLGSQFENSMTLNTTKDTISKELPDSHKAYLEETRQMQSMQNNDHRSYNRQENQYRPHQNNPDRRNGHQANNFQARQHGYNQQKPHNQNFNHPMQQNMHPQGQFYPPQDQQMGNFYGNNYMSRQMPQQFYGMNTFQPQVFPYQVDPNMAGNMNMMAPQTFPFVPNANVGQMPMMNQMYMGANPYMNNYYQMGMQPTMPTPFPNTFPTNNTFQNNTFQNRAQKPVNKQNFVKLDIKNVLENLLFNCRDQNGSRLIQQHFEKASDEEKDQMFAEIIPDALNLMTDVFGNYVIQKILELGSYEQKKGIFEISRGNVYKLSQNTYGCRVVQKILEEFKSEPHIQDLVLKEISQKIFLLIEDQNGNHVIQKCFELVPIEKLQFIVDEVRNKVDQLAMHPYGCRVIQKILETAPEEMTEPMLARLMGRAIECCQCQYGNYIMQNLLEKGPHAEKRQLLEILKKNFVKLSMNKFASNVTEKSAIYGTPDFRHDVVDLLISSPYDNKIALVALMTNSFGNYVIQRIFEYSDDKFKRKIYDRLRQENLDEIKKNNYGKHVMSIIEKWMETQRA